MTPLDYALAYAALGWRVVPIPPGCKYPKGIDQWQTKATTDPTRITKYWSANPTHGIGIATGPGSGLVAIDIDTYAGGDDEWHELEAIHGKAPETVEAITGGGGRHLVFAHPLDVTIVNSDNLPAGIDVRGEGGQIVVAPTIHPKSGKAYMWEVEHDPLEGFQPATMPPWLTEILTRPPVSQDARREVSEYKGGDSIIDRFNNMHTWPGLLEPDGWAFHSKRCIPTTGEIYELWTRPGKTVREGASASLYYKGSDVLKVFTSGAPPLVALETYTKYGYEATMRHGGRMAELGSVTRLAINGTKPTTPQVDEVVINSGSQPYTPLGNARRLVAEYGVDFHHIPQWGAWLTWDGCRWVEDHTGGITRSAKSIVDAFYTQLAMTTDDGDRKRLFAWWMKSQSSAQINDMVGLARTEPGIPVLVDRLDANPWTLNTEGGAVDLATGQTTPAPRTALCTKLAPVQIQNDATCPQWEAFIDWAMGGDSELVAFLRRAVGYTLTGSVKEQVLFFLHGLGSNGKSTFLTVLQHILGDYAFSAEADLLLAVGHERHSTGIADLHGRRMVIVQEVDEGRRLDEALVKRLTGGDMITARRMHQDNFMFTPQHKLWMAANHKPVVRGTDHAIWRRIRLIPFLSTVQDADKDDHLTDKLKMEAAGILQWALAGCAEWQQGGLRAPSTVTAATASYRSEQDHIGRFLDECCTLEPSLAIATKDLRTAYEKWCFETGEQPWKAPAMASQLQERGCRNDRAASGNRTRMWRGISLSGDAAEEMSRRLHETDWAERAAGDKEVF